MAQRFKLHDAVLLATALGLASGCNKDTPKAEQPAAPAETAAALTPKPEVEGPGQPSYSEESFELTLSPKGSYAVDQPAQAQVVLVARGAFKCNDQYPYKLKLDPSEGLQFPKQLITKDAVELQHKSAVMTVDFTPKRAGPATLSGLYSFSVCTDDKCLIEKRKLSLAIDVK